MGHPRRGTGSRAEGRRRIRRIIVGVNVAVLSLWMFTPGAWAQATRTPAELATAIDKVFERWDRPRSPGCAVGVAQRGQVVFTAGYGMANLFTEIVEDRATAYRRLPNGEFRTHMSLTDVIGNGGLLFTVRDALIWNENLDNPRVGGNAMVERLQTRGVLNDGFVNEYAQGLTVTSYRGVREVSHGGSTAGYQTFLARWPDERLSVAVLCNTTGVNPSGYAHQIADLFLAGRLTDVPAVQPVEVSLASLSALAGVYREKTTDAVMRVGFDEQSRAVRIGGASLVPTSPTVLSTGNGARTYTIDAAATGGTTRITESDGHRTKPRVWEREPPFAPTAQQLADYAGDYVCDELGGLVYTFYVDGDALKLRARPAKRETLGRVFPDAFVADGNTVRFTRDANNRVEGLRIYAGRVRNLRFARR